MSTRQQIKKTIYNLSQYASFPEINNKSKKFLDKYYKKNSTKTKKNNKYYKSQTNILKKGLRHLSKHYKNIIIDKLSTTFLGFNKTLTKEDITKISNYLDILNIVYIHRDCDINLNTNNIYEYLKTKIKEMVAH